MPRNGSGTASVPNTFTPLSTADANDVNENFTDIATMITDSLPRSGEAGMTGQLLAISGSASAPGMAFNADTDTGLRRSAANEVAVVCGGADVATASATGFAVIGTFSTSGAASFATTLAVTGASTLTGRVNFGERIVSTGTDAVIGTTTAGQVVLRPNGDGGANTTGQLVVAPAAFTWNGETIYHTGNTVALADGGTGATTAAGARTALELGGLATMDVNDLFYTGSSASNTVFPIGSIIAVAGSSANRNASQTICLSDTDSQQFVPSGHPSAGTALTGTWRARGRTEGDNAYTLMQRVS